MESEQIGLFDRPAARAPSNLLRDPAIAAAVAKCCVKQLAPNDGISYQVHPTECRWCRYPLERKLEAVREFVRWAGFNNITNENPDWPVLEPSVEAFMQLPRIEQARLSTLAAGYQPNEWGEPDTGYEYPGSSTEVRGSTQKVRGNGKSFTDYEKRSGPAPSPTPSGPVGGRDGTGERGSGRLGGTQEAQRTERRGLPDPAPQAPGPQAPDTPVPIDRFHNPDGTEQPF